MIRSFLPLPLWRVLRTVQGQDVELSNFSGSWVSDPGPQPTRKIEVNIKMKFLYILILMVGIIYQIFASMDDTDRNVFSMNVPYGRGLDNELQLARLLMASPRLCYPKRNSEIINTLLGLPKNMNNAGK
ncbi:pigment-dispersing hormone peptide [Vespula maculifrons]|uniref:Pigment-dispersing hormone peptide n=1 Tax=Vespula maculifrons TaxID=7453 RepID=A0ABD2CMA5_VESMC